MRKKFTVWIFAFLLTLGAVEGAAQSFYVVVGAFEGESNAQKFMGYVRSLRYSASYELNESNKLYYVYVLKTQSHAAAAKELHVYKY